MRDRGFGTIEDNVLHFLNVYVGRSQRVKNVRQNTRPVAMPRDQHVGRRRTAREIHDVRNFSSVLEGLNDAYGLGGDGFLRLFGRSADMMRAVNIIFCPNW